MGKYNPNFDKIKARKELRKEENKLKEARKKILSIADTEYKADLKSDIEDVKRAQGRIKKEEVIERAHRRRRTRGKVYSANRAKRKQAVKGPAPTSEQGSPQQTSFNRGGQGYAAREDESLGMRTGAERTKSQSMRDRRDESYGAFGNRPNQRINRKDGGVGSANTISNKDAMTMALEDVKGKAKDEGTRPGNGSSSANTISNRDVQTLKDATKDVKSANTISNRDVQVIKDALEGKAKGGVASYAHGGVEAADKEGSRLSISMERQEDAGYSPSEADFDQQHRLSEEGIMEVGADVKIIQGHNSRASLGETKGVRGTGAMVKGTKFDGVF